MADAMFKLSDGRKIFLMGLATRDTYHTALEGSEEGLSGLYRDRGLAELVARIGAYTAGPDCSAVQVIDPGTPALPSVTCVAHFKMFGQGQDKEVFYSEVLLGWFGEDLVVTRDALKSVVEQLDWDGYAESILTRDL